ncbi:hypothetical protein GGI07_005343 [Coemansia sp. Benny D115]|nr:hypothetical protein GGI07_005343 [Coemansia sp. Benny D115]
MSSEHSQLQRQLYLLGYSQTLPPEATGLVSVLLKDMQAALDLVKELEQQQTKLERDERTSRASGERSKTEAHTLRTENNSLRAEILGLTRDAEKAKREARADAYKWSKSVDDLRMSNLRLRAENAETTRKLAECQQRLEDMVAQRDPAGRLSRMTLTRPLSKVDLHTGMAATGAAAAAAAQPAIVDLVDLSTRRISALEEEIDILETKLGNMQSELKAAELSTKELELEVLRLNTQHELAKPARSKIGAQREDDDTNVAERLNDQIDYLHERCETLERQAKEQSEQFQREKEELHRRWVATENDRVQLSERLRDSGATGTGHIDASVAQSVQRIKDIAVRLKRARGSIAAAAAAAASSDPDHAQKFPPELVDQLYDACQRLLAQHKALVTTPPLSGTAATETQHFASTAPSPSPPTADSERLQAELANIKSLYAQTRDQLQELLKTGNADFRRSLQAARETEAALRSELEQLHTNSQAEIQALRQSLEDMPEYKLLSEAREKQVARLEKRAAELSESLESARQAHARETERLKDKVAELQRRQAHLESSAEEYARLIEQHRKLDKSLKQAVDEVGEWRAKYDEREHKLGDLARRAEEYRLSYKQSATELRTCKKTLDTYTRELSTLRDARDNMQRENERLVQELDQVSRIRQAVEMSKDDYKRQLTRSLSENESHRSLVEHLQAERSALRVQVKAQFHLSQRLEQRLESLDPTYASAKPSTKAGLFARTAGVGTGADGNRINKDGGDGGIDYDDDIDTVSSLGLSLSSGLRSGKDAGRKNPVRMLSRSSSAAHSSRSFGNAGSDSNNGLGLARRYSDREMESTSTISMP